METFARLIIFDPDNFIKVLTQSVWQVLITTNFNSLPMPPLNNNQPISNTIQTTFLYQQVNLIIELICFRLKHLRFAKMLSFLKILEYPVFSIRYPDQFFFIWIGGPGTKYFWNVFQFYFQVEFHSSVRIFEKSKKRRKRLQNVDFETYIHLKNVEKNVDIQTLFHSLGTGIKKKFHIFWIFFFKF